MRKDNNMREKILNFFKEVEGAEINVEKTQSEKKEAIENEITKLKEALSQVQNGIELRKLILDSKELLEEKEKDTKLGNATERLEVARKASNFIETKKKFEEYEKTMPDRIYRWKQDFSSVEHWFKEVCYADQGFEPGPEDYDRFEKHKKTEMPHNLYSDSLEEIEHSNGEKIEEILKKELFKGGSEAVNKGIKILSEAEEKLLNEIQLKEKSLENI